MVEIDESGGVTISARQITVLGALAGGAIFVGTGIFCVALAYAHFEDANQAIKEDLGRSWAALDDRKKSLDTISFSLNELRDVSNTRHEEMMTLISRLGADKDALSANIRALSENQTAVTAALTQNIHEQSAKSDQILSKMIELETSVAQLEVKVDIRSPGTNGPHKEIER